MELGSPNVLSSLVEATRIQCGTDLSHRASPWLTRAVLRRMGATRTASLDEYLRLVRNSAAEACEFAGEATACESAFFSEPREFDELRTAVWPRLFSGQKIRIWAPDCGHGAHLYSIALSAFEYSAEAQKIRFIGTDPAESSLESARAGVFSDGVVAGLPLGFLKRWFRQREGGWQIAVEIRSCVVLSRHRLGTDPEFESVDMVALRHGLNCYEPGLQRLLLERLPRALAPGGFLWIAGAEPRFTVPGCTRLGAASPFFRRAAAHPARRSSNHRRPAAAGPVDPQQVDPRPDPASHVRMLEALPVAAVVLDRSLAVQFFTLAAGDLFSLTHGDLGRSLTDLRPTLKPDHLTAGLLQAQTTGAPAHFDAETRDAVPYRIDIWPYPLEVGAPALLLIASERSGGSQSAAEHCIQSFMGAVAAPVALLDETGRIRHASSGFYTLINCAAGASVPDVLDAGGSPGSGDRLRALIASSAHGSAGTLEAAVGQRSLVFRCAPAPGGVLLSTDESATMRQERSRLETALERTNEELRSLTASVFRAQEDERRKVARELHDDLAQRLALLEVSAERVGQMAAGAPTSHAEALVELCRNAAEISNELRRIAHQLHPSALDDFGLRFALKSLAGEFGRHRSIPVTFEARGPAREIPADVATALYRIAQEALRNIDKHAGPTHARIVLTSSPDGLELTVRDYGRGFHGGPEMPNGIGLLSMKERARLVGASLSLQTKPGRGTAVRVKVPLALEAET